MDSKMKGMVMAGMVVGALLFALIAVLGSSWITMDEDGAEANYGLSEAEVKFGGATMTMEYSEMCDDSDDSEPCDLATAGTIGTFGLWIGILLAAAFAAMLILPMAGIDAMDNIPDVGKMVIQWGTGAMMLIGAIGWLIMKPELEDGMGLGLSFWLAMIAGLLALGTPAMDMFVAADDE